MVKNPMNTSSIFLYTTKGLGAVQLTLCAPETCLPLDIN